MLAIIDTSVLLAAAASFIAGLMGYLIVRLWIKPIVGYQIAKRRLDRELTEYLHRLDTSDPSPQGKTQAPADQALLRRARRHAMRLIDCYEKEIPYWYRLLLDSRREAPPKVAGLLDNLMKIKDLQQRRRRIQHAREVLRLI